ncbi:MAG: bud emergence protein 1 [Stictis urceolatum]|nr:bud emergence protein 1 [Stictis urceolata]
MKALRRSIKGDKDTRPHHISIQPKSATAIIPPKKVIKALYDYTHEPDPTKSDEENSKFLSFYKGDFFHVIGRENEEDWYEACHPGPDGVRGLVPVSYFEVFGKNGRTSTGSAASAVSTPNLPDSGYSTGGSHGRSESQQLTPKTPGHQRGSSMSRGAMVYGIVQYDFNAERPDELDAKAGEAIIVIAQSNPEWFVAKPIGRLGGPGLIPVSFIEIKDMATGKTVSDPHQAVQAAGVPKVEEWKKLAADYKNSSISLGKFDVANGGTQQLQRGMERMSVSNDQQDRSNGYNNTGQQAQQHPPPMQQQPPQHQQLLAPVSASIPRYCFENDKYWYIIECVLEDGSHWELSRFYQNFYDFQIALLQQFPAEAATDGGTRILPFMPGPVTYVTDAISNGRRESLNEYVKRLLALPPYISKCQLVRQLFAPREGDFELDPKAMQEDYRLSGGSHHSSEHNQNLDHQDSNGQINGGGSYPPQQRSQQWGSQQYPSYPSNSSINSSINPQSQGQQRYQTPPQGYNPSASNTQLPGQPPASGALKIKVWFEDECIAIRVPADINFDQLMQKIQDRLKVDDQLLIQYKDEPSGGERLMSNDEDLDTALQRNARLQLYVGYAWEQPRR